MYMYIFNFYAAPAPGKNFYEAPADPDRSGSYPTV
jgi:hypothetical protein